MYSNAWTTIHYYLCKLVPYRGNIDHNDSTHMYLCAHCKPNCHCLHFLYNSECVCWEAKAGHYGVWGCVNRLALYFIYIFIIPMYIILYKRVCMSSGHITTFIVSFSAAIHFFCMWCFHLSASIETALALSSNSLHIIWQNHAKTIKFYIQHRLIVAYLGRKYHCFLT